MRLRIPRDSFLVSPTPLTLYDLLGGLGAALPVGLSMVLPLPLLAGLVPVMGVDGGGGWVGGGGLVSVIRRRRGGGGGSGGVYFKEVLRPEIKCRQYLSSMAKCAHVLSAPVLSTPGIISRRLRTMDFLFVCSTLMLLIQRMCVSRKRVRLSNCYRYK